MTDPGTEFRHLLHAGAPLVAPGVFDGLSAKLVKQAGFKAAYASGGAIARSLGLPDLGLVGLAEMAQRLAQIVEAAGLPVFADGDTGHGTALHVTRTVQSFEAAGIAGLHLEDQRFPKRCGHAAGKALIPAAEMVDKISAAVDGRRSADFVIAARTDAVAIEGFEAALARAQIYAEAGAELLFVEAPETIEQIAAIPQRFDVPTMINMFRGGRTPYVSQEDLGRYGYSLVIIPSDLQRAVIRSMSEILEAIARDGDSSALADRLCPLPERDTAVEESRWLAIAERFGG